MLLVFIYFWCPIAELRWAAHSLSHDQYQTAVSIAHAD